MLLRSVLYTPSSSVRMIEKGLKAGADRVIIDLEDAVHVHNKEVARANLNQVAVSKRAVLRVNGLDTTWGKQDVQAAIALNYATIVLPKVNGKRDIEELVSITKGAVDIWAMIETPLGVLHANEIASCKQVSTLVLGTSDLAKELECETSMQRSELMTSFGLTLLAAKAYGKRILDGVHLDLSDTTGFEFACMQAKQLGFDGKTLIHPKVLNFKFLFVSFGVDNWVYQSNVFAHCSSNQICLSSTKGV